jgi:hypothetical protein
LVRGTRIVGGGARMRWTTWSRRRRLLSVKLSGDFSVMPQPVTLPPPPFQYGSKALAERPELALGIAAVNAEWTVLEHRMAEAFGFVLGQDERVAFEIYRGFFERGLRDSIFRQLAADRLESEEAKALKKLQTDIRRGSEPRNKVAHAMWAASDHYPDDLLLMDWSVVNLAQAAAIHSWPQAPANKPIRYQASDFMDILDGIFALQDRVYEFAKTLMFRAIRGSIEHSRKSDGKVPRHSK